MELSEEDFDLRDYLGVHIGYRTGYIDQVWTSAFAGDLRRLHRQLLFDLLATCSEVEVGRVDLPNEEC
jgi:hypothetical protein